MNGQDTHIENGLEIFTDPFECDKFIQRHKCSDCWSPLAKVQTADSQQGARKFQALCERCQGQTRGYVSNKTVDRRTQANKAEAQEAKHNLRQALPWMQPKQTEAELLKGLGY